MGRLQVEAEQDLVLGERTGREDMAGTSILRGLALAKALDGAYGGTEDYGSADCFRRTSGCAHSLGCTGRFVLKPPFDRSL